MRAGARLLLQHASFQVTPGDKIGLVGRNGAGKTTLTKILAGEAQPAAGQVTQGRTGGLPAAGPADRRSGRAGEEPDPGGTRTGRGGGPAAEGRAGDGLGLGGGAGRGDVGLRPRRDGAGGRRRLRGGGGGGADRQQPRTAGARAAPATADTVGWSAAAGRTGPDPVLGRRDAAAGRADQPPGRRLDRLAAELPPGPRRRIGGDQPRRRAAGAHRHEGVPPRRPARGARRLRHELAALPRTARDRREAAPPRTAERRTQGRPAVHPGRQDAGQGHQGHRGPEHGPTGRAAAGRDRGRAVAGPGGQDQVSGACALREDSARARAT